MILFAPSKPQISPLLTAMVLIVSLLVAGCSTPPLIDRDTDRRRADSTTATSESTTTQAQAQSTKPPAATPVILEPPHWIGKRFVFVEKVAMFRKFGYPLYRSPRLDSSRSPLDSSIQLANHRLRYEPFAGAAATVKAVEKHDDGEYLVTFTTDTLDLTVYGRTRNGIIEGIHPEEDLAAARKRWVGRTVFSRRRLVDTYDSAASRFSTIKVSIREPLRVTAVRWGMTPLPPKPLWLIVEGADSLRGIIPVNYSWTNVPPSKRTDRLPWTMDILEEDPRTNPWPEAIWEAIDSSKILTGMTHEQVRLSWGEPSESRRRLGDGGATILELVYPGTTLVFEGDTLVEGREGDRSLSPP